MRKPTFCICENKGADQPCGTWAADLISDFVFATLIVEFRYFSNAKFQASSHLLGLYSRVLSDLFGNPKTGIPAIRLR